MRAVIFYFAFLFVFVNIHASGKTDSLLTAGVENIYKFNFEKAKSDFRLILSINNSDFRAYYYFARINLLRYLGSKNEKFRIEFFRYAELTEKSIDRILDKNPDDQKALLFAGKIHQDISTAEAYKLEMTDAFWSARKSVSYFEDVLDINPENCEAIIHLAIFNYSLSSVSGFYSFILKLAGLSPDFELALKRLRDARSFSKNNPELDFHLAVVYSQYYSEYNSAVVLLENLRRKFPNNIIFSYQLGNAYLQMGNIHKAEEIFRHMMKIIPKEFTQIEAMTSFKLGEIKFLENNFAEAVKFYNKFITKTSDINFLGIASLRNAVCYYSIGDDDRFKKNLSEVNLGNEDLPEDSYAFQLGNSYLKNSFTNNDLRLWQVRNNFMRGEYSEIVESALKVNNDLYLSENKLFLFFLIRSYLELDKLEHASELLNRVLSKGNMIDKEMYTQFLMLRADINFRKKEMRKTHEVLNSISELPDYTDFGYKASDILRIKFSLKKIKK